MSPGRSTFMTDAMRQTAVYWGNPRSDGAGGRTFDDPIELQVRWEYRQDLFIDMTGQEVRSEAVVYMPQDVDPGGYLYLGEMADLSEAQLAAPLTLTEAREIRGISKSPDIGAERFARKAWL